MSHTSEIPKGAKKFIYSAFLILISAIYYSLPNFGVNVPLPKSDTASTSSPATYYKVTKVVDGDTIQIDINGTLEKLRLIGINTPETVDPRKPVECFGKEASAETHKLADGKIVRLEYDNSQSLRDAYNRLLVYVYLEDGEMINRKLVAEGYAYEYTYMTPYKYQKEFRDLQNFARTQGRGLWADNTCAGSKTLKQN